jgi:AbrB family looped-hinge helix DNA binding protein
MELAKITLRGQITIPAGIRKKLNVRDGDKVVFIEENGRIVMENSVKVALKDIQNAFKGEAERLDLKDEQDVVAMIKETRQKKQAEANAGHA